jgi:hypothetical protein
MNCVENLNSIQLGKMFKIFKSSSMQSLNIFRVWDSFLFEIASLSGVWKLEKLFYQAGPTSQRPMPVSNRMHQWPYPAHHLPGHRTMTTLTAESAQAPIAAIAHAGAALSSAEGGSLPFPFLLPRCSASRPPLCLACGHRARLTIDSNLRDTLGHGWWLVHRI